MKLLQMLHHYVQNTPITSTSIIYPVLYFQVLQSYNGLKLRNFDTYQNWAQSTTSISKAAALLLQLQILWISPQHYAGQKNVFMAQGIKSNFALKG